MSQPCMCGATDCPRCFPGCENYCECEVCGGDELIEDLDDGICQQCKDLEEINEKFSGKTAEEIIKLITYVELADGSAYQFEDHKEID